MSCPNITTKTQHGTKNRNKKIKKSVISNHKSDYLMRKIFQCAIFDQLCSAAVAKKNGRPGKKGKGASSTR